MFTVLMHLRTIVTISHTLHKYQNNQVDWAPVARSYFQERIRGIPGSILRGNNAWPVRMPLHTSWISRPPMMGRKPVRKPKKKKQIPKLLFNK